MRSIYVLHEMMECVQKISLLLYVKMVLLYFLHNYLHWSLANSKNKTKMCAIYN